MTRMRRLAATLAFGVCMASAYHASAHATLDQLGTAPPPSLAARAPHDAPHRSRIVVGGSACTASAAETWPWSDARRRELAAPGSLAHTREWDGTRHRRAYELDLGSVLLAGGRDGRRRTSAALALRSHARERTTR